MEKNDSKIYSVREIEGFLSRYKHILGLAVFCALLILIFFTIQNFQKQNQIADKCGFMDGKVKCVCTKEAWDQWMGEVENPLQYQIPQVNISNG